MRLAGSRTFRRSRSRAKVAAHSPSTVFELEHLERLFRFHRYRRAGLFRHDFNIAFLAATSVVPNYLVLGAILGHGSTGRTSVHDPYTLTVADALGRVALVSARVPMAADRVHDARFFTGDRLTPRTALAGRRRKFLGILCTLWTNDGPLHLVHLSSRGLLANVRLALVPTGLPLIAGLADVAVLVLAEQSRHGRATTVWNVHHGEEVILRQEAGLNASTWYVATLLESFNPSSY